MSIDSRRAVRPETSEGENASENLAKARQPEKTNAHRRATLFATGTGILTVLAACSSEPVPVSDFSPTSTDVAEAATPTPRTSTPTSPSAPPPPAPPASMDSNAAPRLLRPIEDMTLQVEDGVPLSLDLSSYFEDPDADDTLSFEGKGLLPTGLLFDDKQNESNAALRGYFLSGMLDPRVGSGTFTLSIAVTDGKTPIIEQFEIIVLANNRPPAFLGPAGQNLQLNEGVTLDLETLFTDPDAEDVLTISVTDGLPEGLTLAADSDGVLLEGEVTNKALVGTEQTLTLSVTDSEGAGGDKLHYYTLTILDASPDASEEDTSDPEPIIPTEGEVAPPEEPGPPGTNSPPVFSSVLTGQEWVIGETLALDLNTLFTDPDGDSLGFRVRFKGDFSALGLNNGVFASPAANSSLVGETRVLTITASDPSGATGRGLYTLTFVASANRDPELTTPLLDQTLKEEEAFSLDLNAHFTDPDGDDLTLTVSGLPEHLEFENGTISGVFPYDSSHEPTRLYTIQVQASDGRGGVLEEDFVLTVENVNRPPILTQALPVRLVQTTRSTILVPREHFEDPDGDTISYKILFNNVDNEGGYFLYFKAPPGGAGSWDVRGLETFQGGVIGAPGLWYDVPGPRGPSWDSSLVEVPDKFYFSVAYTDHGGARNGFIFRPFPDRPFGAHITVTLEASDRKGGVRTAEFILTSDVATLEASAVPEDTAAATKLSGAEAGKRLGLDAAWLGDVNGDGMGELLVRTQGDLLVVAPDLASDAGLEITGRIGGDLIDLSDAVVAGAGDVNGDGFSDVLVGVPFATHGRSDYFDMFNSRGAVYVYFGASDFLTDWTSGGEDDDPRLFSSVPAERGFVLVGDRPGSFFGISVASAGDLDGDGLGDFIVADRVGEGKDGSTSRAYVIFGQQDDMFGEATRIDAEGMVVSDPDAPPESYIAQSVLDIATLKPHQGFIIHDSAEDDFVVQDIASAGDFDGDGYDDLVISLYRNVTKPLAMFEGEVVVLYGMPGQEGFGEPGEDGRYYLDLDLLTPDRGFIGYFRDISPGSSRPSTGLVFPEDDSIEASPDLRVSQVEGIGDFNGDGLDDLLVRYERADGDGARQAYVVFGREGKKQAGLNLGATFRASDGFILWAGPGEHLGVEMVSLGDFNGDGFSDFAITAARNESDTTNPNKVYVVFGRHDLDVWPARAVEDYWAGRIGFAPYVFKLEDMDIDEGFVFIGPDGDRSFGRALARASSGTGFDDLIIGAYDGDGATSGDKAGEVYRVRGGPQYGKTVIHDQQLDSEDHTRQSLGQQKSLLGGAGPDELLERPGASVDVFYGGAGADVLILSDADFLRVDGGSGVDTLVLGESVTLDIPARRASVRSIENFSLSDGALLRIDPFSVYGLTPLRAQDGAEAGETKIKINGSGTLVLELPPSGDWVLEGDLTDDAPDLYRFENAILEVASTVTVIRPAPTKELLPPDEADDTSVKLPDILASAGVGDVDGDGLPDLLLGVSVFKPGRFSYTHSIDRSEIVLLRGDGSDSVKQIDQALLDRSTHFVVQEGSKGGLDFVIAGGFYIRSAELAGVGDFNGDLLADFAVGLPFELPYGKPTDKDFGRAYLFYGKTDFETNPLSLDKFDTTLGQRDGLLIKGIYDDEGDTARRGTSGFSVAGAGDLNGDGLDDLIIGAPGWGSNKEASVNTGRVYVIYGDPYLKEVNLDNLYFGDGFVIEGQIRQERLGLYVEGIGDFDGDGLADIVINGASGVNAAGDGLDIRKIGSYVIYGMEGTYTPYFDLVTRTKKVDVLKLDELEARHGFAITGNKQPSPVYGPRAPDVKAAGDFDGDGYEDLLVRTWVNDRGLFVHLIYGGPGRSSKSLDLSKLPEDGRLSFTSSAPHSYFHRVASAGDLNGDGLDDIILGTTVPPASLVPGARKGEGQQAFVIYGREDRDPRSIDVSKLAREDGFVILASAMNDKIQFHSFSSLGDVDGDGYEDLLIGVTSDGVRIQEVIFYGSASSDGMLSVSDLDKVSGLDDFRLRGGAGADTLTEHKNGAVEVFYGGAGDDTFVLSDTDFRRIDGGTGDDTLRLGPHVILDLTERGRGLQLRSLETLSISAESSLTLDLRTIYNLTEQRDNGGSKTDPGEVFIRIEGAGKLALLSDRDDSMGLPWEFVEADTTTETWRLHKAVVQIDKSIRLSFQAPIINLKSMTLTEGFYVDNIEWESTKAGLGSVIATGGDVNGDGLGDFLVRGTKQEGGDWNHNIYVIYGKEGERPSFNLDAFSKADGYVIRGLKGLLFGDYSVSFGGDLNRDGFSDIVIGSPNRAGSSTYDGGVYVFFGQADPVDIDSETLRTAPDDDDGFVLRHDKHLGYGTKVILGARYPVGDSDGDGYDDLLVSWGSPYITSDGGGRAYLFYGMSDWTGLPDEFFSTPPDVSEAFTLSHPIGHNRSAFDGVTGIGDFNGDGLGDFLVQGVVFSGPGAPPHGTSYVIYGKAGQKRALLQPEALKATDGLKIIHADDGGSYLGKSGAAIGDINGDGFDDFAFQFSGPEDGGRARSVVVLYGREDGIAEIDVAELDPSDGFSIYLGEYRHLTQIFRGGDVNGDGFSDLFISDFGFEETGLRAGRAYIIFGMEAFESDIHIRKLDESQGVIFETGDRYEYVGDSGSAGSDLNGDGFDDILIGAPGSKTLVSTRPPDPDGTPHLPTYRDGRVYAVYGGTHLGDVSDDDQDLRIFDSPYARGAAGDDVLTEHESGVIEVFYGGAGDDTFTLADADFRRVDGGRGRDTLVLGEDVLLDLTRIPRLGGHRGLIRSTEAFVISTGAALALDPASVYALTEQRKNGGTLTDKGQVLIDIEIEKGASFFLAGKTADDEAWTQVSSTRDGDVVTRVVRSGNALVRYTTEVPEGVVPLDPAASFTLEADTYRTILGEKNLSLLGLSVGHAGDVNGDGLADFVITALGSHNRHSRKAFVIYGQEGTSVPDLKLEALALDGTDGFVIHDDPMGSLRSSYLTAYEPRRGDINGDGLDDLVLSAYLLSDSSHAGAYVIYGRSHETGSGPGHGPGRDDIITSEFSFPLGFKIAAASRHHKPALAIIGDVNGDGIDDIALGARVDGPGYVNRVYVIYGDRDPRRDFLNLREDLTPDQGFVLESRHEDVFRWDDFSRSIASAGDINGDGLEDLLITARFANDFRGDVYVVYGEAGTSRTTMDIYSLDAADGFKISGKGEEALTLEMASAGDFNGDGLDDILLHIRPYIGTYGDDGGEDSVYIIYGKAGRARADLVITDLTAEDGLKIESSSPTTTPISGYRDTYLASAGDLNGDGLDDIFIGSHRIESDALSGRRLSYVLYGHFEPGSLDLDNLEPWQGVVIPGPRVRDPLTESAFGKHAAGVGDSNGDGFDDLLISDYRWTRTDLTPGTKAGASFLLYGGPHFLITDPAVVAGLPAKESGHTFKETVPGTSMTQDVLALRGLSGPDRLGESTATDISVFYGGAGDDIISLSDANFRRIDGGNGLDALHLGPDVTLDLTAVDQTEHTSARRQVRSIETVSLDTDSRLVLDLATIYGLTELRNNLDEVPGLETFFPHFAIGGGGPQGFFLLRIEGSGALDLKDPSWTSFVLGDTLFYRLGRVFLQVDKTIDVSLIHPEVRFDKVPFPSEKGFSVRLGLPFDIEAHRKAPIYSFDGAGDINGDGIGDFIVGAYGSLPESQARSAFIVYGQLGKTRGQLLLESLTESEGYPILKVNDGGNFGTSVAGIGDFNGDGFDDVAIGAPNASGPSGPDDAPGIENTGEVHIIYGTKAGRALDADALRPSEGFVIRGALPSGGAHAYFGFVLSEAGDINGDGFEDLAITAPAQDRAATPARAYIIYGRAESPAAATGAAEGDPRVLDIASLTKEEGFIIQGRQRDDGFERSIASAGDVNGDGIDDLILGARDASSHGSPQGSTVGEAYVLFGKRGDGSQFGSPEAPLAAPPGTAPSPERQLVDLDKLGPSDGFLIFGNSLISFYYGSVGETISGVGDVNGDGYDDILVGAPINRGTSGERGGAYLIYGMETEELGSVETVHNLLYVRPSDGFEHEMSHLDSYGTIPSAIGHTTAFGSIEALQLKQTLSSLEQRIVDLEALTPEAGVIFTISSSYPNFGWTTAGSALGGGGDIDGDGLADLLIADRTAPSVLGDGVVYLVYGQAGSGLGSLASSTTGRPALGHLRDIPKFAIPESSTVVYLDKLEDAGFGQSFETEATNDVFGWNVDVLGDLNRDGFDDFAVDSSRVDPPEPHIILATGTTFGGPARDVFVVYGEDRTSRPSVEAPEGSFLGTSGDDTLTETAMAPGEVFYGGAGDDTIVLIDEDVRRVDGGSGINTLVLQKGITLDLREEHDVQNIASFRLEDRARLSLDEASLTRLTERGRYGDTNVRLQPGEDYISIAGQGRVSFSDEAELEVGFSPLNGLSGKVYRVGDSHLVGVTGDVVVDIA